MATTRVNISELRDSIEKVVRLLSDRGVKVTQQGMKAYVKYEKDDSGTLVPQQVNVPSVGENSSPDLVIAIKGFVDHEVAHIIFTDPKILERAKKEGIVGMHNLVEDCFIEAMMKKTFPGSIRNIDKTIKFACSRFFQKQYDENIDSFECGTGEASQARFFLDALAVPGIRALAGHEAAIDFMSDKWGLVPIVHELLEPLSDKLQRLNSSLAALNMAHTIRDLLIQSEEEEERRKGEETKESEKKDEAQKTDGEKPNGDDHGNTDSGGDDTDGDGERCSDIDSGDDGLPEDQEGEEHDGKCSQNEYDMDAEDASASPDFVSHDGTKNDHSDLLEAIEDVKSFEDGLEEAITEGAMSSIDSQSYQPYSTSGDRIEKVRLDESKKANAMDRLALITQDNQNNIGIMSKQLERLIAARNRSMLVPGFRSGRLHSASLYKLRTGDTRVFRRKEDVTAINTAVMLLVDCSGSMTSNDRINKASEAAFALCSSLEIINVPTQVMGFTTQYDRSLLEAVGSEMRELHSRFPDKAFCFDRVEPLEMPIFKTFDERMTPDVKQNLAAIPFLVPLRNNADGESVEIAGNILMRRQEERRILVVLSDGEPAMQSLESPTFVARHGPCASSQRSCQHLSNVVNNLEARGIETLGIGIETPGVNRFYPRSIVLDSVQELPEKVLNELSGMLLK